MWTSHNHRLTDVFLMQCAECSESNRNIVILVLILVHEGTLAQSTLLDFAAQRQLCALTYQTSPHSSGSCYSDSMSCQHWLKVPVCKKVEARPRMFCFIWITWSCSCWKQTPIRLLLSLKFLRRKEWIKNDYFGETEDFLSFMSVC